MEIATDLPGNPIIQDKTKKGEPRFYFLDSLVNYGAIPQTYEDPEHKDAWTGLAGDGDPIDVCEIGSALAPTGGVYTVKVLGALAMLDGGETDWKVLAVRTDDPLAERVSDIASNAPDSVLKAADAIREWFRTYKIPEGKGENSFAFDGKWLDRDTTLKIIESTHVQWKETLARRTGKRECGVWPRDLSHCALLLTMPSIPSPPLCRRKEAALAPLSAVECRQCRPSQLQGQCCSSLRYHYRSACTLSVRLRIGMEGASRLLSTHHLSVLPSYRFAVRL